ncbi:GFA family protein [Nocardioides zhouii]|uniref:GFA family protein n=1 Tax=Nocardioides zhouii TaxID=1168729 RepID=A0A4Q2SSG8_9ACTN|nr:GFA family protein [Nocardioides zhouii]RYC07119.1 GFA family protein [Nocardioides zhouii]
MSTHDEPARGRSLCGAVAYVVRGDLRPVVNCHCARCRRFTGHHVAVTAAAVDDLEVVDARGDLTWFAVSGAAYAFCRACGSSLFWRSEDSPGTWSICAGTLEVPTHLSTAEAWWVSEASDYAARPDLPERLTE